MLGDVQKMAVGQVDVKTALVEQMTCMVEWFLVVGD